MQLPKVLHFASITCMVDLHRIDIIPRVSSGYLAIGQCKSSNDELLQWGKKYDNMDRLLELERQHDKSSVERKNFTEKLKPIYIVFLSM